MSMVKDLRKDLTPQDVAKVRMSLNDLFLEVLNSIVENGDVQKLRPGEKADFLIKLASFIVPKAVEVKGDGAADERDLNKLLAAKTIEETLKKQRLN